MNNEQYGKLRKEAGTMNQPILMTEEYWANSQLSVVRHTGSIQLKDAVYTIIDKRGHTIFECSVEAEKEGRDMAIEPGEPVDLVHNDFIKFYRKLGRDKFISTLRAYGDKSVEDYKRMFTQVVKDLKTDLK